MQDEEVWEIITNLKGTVTETNMVYQSFTLKLTKGGRKLPAFIANCLDLKHFPRPGDEITISEALLCENQLYLSGDSQILIQDPLGPQNSRLTFILQRSKLGIKELKMFHNEFPEVDLSSITLHSRENIKLNLLEMVMRRGEFHVPNLATTSNLLYVIFQKTYPNSLYYSHGVHHNLPDQYLVGKLMVDNSGLIILTDGFTYQHLLIVTKKRFELFKFNDKLVYLDKFIVFTEMYERVGNTQYIYCHINDIHMFGAPASQRRALCLVQQWVANEETRKVVQIVIVNIATPSQAANLADECWLEVLMRNSGSPDWTSCFLSLHSDSLLILPFLDVGGAYHIFLTKPLEEVSNVELGRLAPRTPKYRIPTNSAKFVPIPPPPSPYTESPVLDVPQTVEVMRNLPHKTTKRVNFDGMVYIKGFTNADSFTRTPPYSSSSKYGTPGSKRHYLRFQVFKGRKGMMNFTIYLNNWERLYRPLGLLSQLQLRFYNVDLSRNYAKVNALTRIEVRGFAGSKRFNCANLNFRSNVVFYAPICNGHAVPWGVLIRTKVTLSFCKKFVVELDRDDIIRLKIMFVAMDGIGEGLLLCNSLDFFKRFLFDNEGRFRDWLEWFKNLRSFNYYEFNNDLPEYLKLPYENFHKTVRSKLNGVHQVDVLCRKKEPGDLAKLGRSIWNVTKVYNLVSARICDVSSGENV